MSDSYRLGVSSSPDQGLLKYFDELGAEGCTLSFFEDGVNPETPIRIRQWTSISVRIDYITRNLSLISKLGFR